MLTWRRTIGDILGFSWKGQCNCFKSLPFGLSTAPYLFNKLVKVLVRYWRENGIKCMMFFDDGSAGAETRVEADEVARIVRQSLNKAGWKIHEEKSCLVPSQKPTIRLCSGFGGRKGICLRKTC